MNKTKIITILLLLVATVVITGCSGTLARNSNAPKSGHHEEITQAAWYETESIDVDWPF